MSGKFYLTNANTLIKYELDPGPRHLCGPYYTPRGDRDFYKDLLKGRTGVAIFGYGQDVFLEAFENAPVKILFKSKKCVNPNYKNTGPRNTVVIFEELD